MASVAGVVCFGSGAAKSQHFSRFHTFYSRTGADVGFLKVPCDFRQQFFGKTEVDPVFRTQGTQAPVYGNCTKQLPS